MKKREITFEMVTTKGGDMGETSLHNGERRRKDDLVMDVVGSLDELGAFLGLARAELKDIGKKNESDIIIEIQKTLFIIGGEVATPENDKIFKNITRMTEKNILFLEKEEKILLKTTTIKPVFVTAGENRVSASVDVARAVCRRAERYMVNLIRERGFTYLATGQRFLNRLSDLLFILARSLETGN
ncbi:MAG: cob(I)yrinic acid a,c-diamide adenosyltransferase [Spirochaetales bacterium]|nr:cob(I)yrinic acid a,c-diamide adenosyltransferase [Spirochaetales bacterium]